jgi:hypothetical protein
MTLASRPSPPCPHPYSSSIHIYAYTYKHNATPMLGLPRRRTAFFALLDHGYIRNIIMHYYMHTDTKPISVAGKAKPIAGRS